MPDNPRDTEADGTELVTRYGPIRVPTVDPHPITHALAKFGEGAQYEIRFAAGNLTDGARIADIRAFVGTFGLGLARLITPGNLCFFEPDDGAAAQLRDNVARNAPAIVIAEFDASTFCAEHGPFDLIRYGDDPINPATDQFRAHLTTGTGALLLPCDESIDSLDLAASLLSDGFTVTYFAFPTFAQDNFNAAEGSDEPVNYESRLWITRGTRPRLDPDLADAGCFVAPITSR
jgi:hypothetical protein